MSREQVCLTLDLVGGLLLAPEVFATILGKAWADRVVKRIEAFGVWLKPRKHAAWITLRPISFISFAMALAGMVFVAAWELRNPSLRAWAHPDGLTDAQRMNPTWALRYFVLVLPPLFL